MNKDNVRRLILITEILYAALFVGLSIILFFYKDNFTFKPWTDSEPLNFAWTASSNGERIVFTQNSQKSVLVLNNEKELLYQLNAKPKDKKSFSLAMFVEIDEENNLYLLDINFGGVLQDNVERVLKYSPNGKFIEEIYAYRYINDEFIITKGKISGMAYHKDVIYLIRLENDGFYLDRVSKANRGEPEGTIFFDYPDAFRELTYCCINTENERLAVTTKSGAIKQYDFSGALINERLAPDGNSPWMTVLDNNNNLIYTDIINGEIVSINTVTDEYVPLFTGSEGKTYYQINYVGGTFFAIAEEEILLQGKNGEAEHFDSYSYSKPILKARIILFAFFFIDIVAFLVFILTFIRFLPRKQFSENFKLIMLSGVCIVFGSGISSIVIIDEMNTRNFDNTYTDLENVSRLVASSIDTDVLTSLNSSAQISSEEYRYLSGGIKNLFSQLPFNGKRAYLYIWMERDGVVYSMYDSESALGVLFPFDEYGEDSYYRKVYDSKEYVYDNNVTVTGSWLFVCGPVFDRSGNVAALIETGYNMTTVQEQTRSMIVQTMLIVIAGTIAFLLIVIEFILINNAYARNKLDWVVDQRMPFRPELLRAIIFIMYVAGNLATALLPMYAANLYQPLFNLPREFVVTLPFTMDVVFVSLALVVVPNILKKLGIKRLSIMAALFYVVGYILCLIATNTTYLAVAYAFTGFAGGTIILVINTIIGGQKDVEAVNSGFAHYNASYLAGTNVGVVLGSILAQFFPYRFVYFFSFLAALVLLMVSIFSTRSKYLKYLFDGDTEEAVKEDDGKNKKEPKFTLLKFILKPTVIGTLVLLLMPYMVSMSFTNYFLPLFGTENGLTESNIGQLILLSGLFAILFGTSLCEYIGKKLPIKLIIFLSLLVNAGGIYLFSINVSVPMLIAATVIVAIANIFVLTNVQTYYATLYQNTRVSSMKALSVYSAVENVSMMFGPILFSYILATNVAGGMNIFSIASLGCIALFILISTIFRDRDQTSRKNEMYPL